MEVQKHYVNLLPEPRKIAVSYCKITFGNAALTSELLGLGGVRCGMLLTFPKRQGGGSFCRYYGDSLDCGYPILWQGWQFLQGGVLGWIRWSEYTLLVNTLDESGGRVGSHIIGKVLGHQGN